MISREAQQRDVIKNFKSTTSVDDDKLRFSGMSRTSRTVRERCLNDG